MAIGRGLCVERNDRLRKAKHRTQQIIWCQNQPNHTIDKLSAGLVQEAQDYWDHDEDTGEDRSDEGIDIGARQEPTGWQGEGAPHQIAVGVKPALQLRVHTTSPAWYCVWERSNIIEVVEIAIFTALKLSQSVVVIAEDKVIRSHHRVAAGPVESAAQVESTTNNIVQGRSNVPPNQYFSILGLPETNEGPQQKQQGQRGVKYRTVWAR